MYNRGDNSAQAATVVHDVRGVCEVHALVDGDRAPRLVRYCNLCKAWMCDDCRKHWLRRWQAFRARRGH